MRSDSLTRSSCAPRTTVSPSAKQPSSATSGSSSIASGTSSGSTTVPSSGAVGDVEVADRLLRRASSPARPRGRRARSPPSAAGSAGSRCASSSRRRRSISSREPATSTPAAIRNAAELGSPGTSTPSSSSSSVFERPSTSASVAVDRDAGAQQHPLGVVAAARRLDRRSSSPSAASAGEQHARLDLRAGDRQLVGDRAQRARRGRCSGGKRPSRASSRAPICAQRLGDPVDRPAADRLVAVERERRAPAARRASRAAAASACRRCRRRSAPVGLARLAQAGAADHELVVVAPRRARRARAPRRASRACRRRAGSCSIAHRLGGHRAEQRGAVGDRLVGRRAKLARSSPPRARSGRSCARHREAETPAISSRRARRGVLRRRDPQRDDALAACPAAGDSAMSAMLTPARPSASASSATTPGRFGTETRSSARRRPRAGARAARRRSSRGGVVPGA